MVLNDSRVIPARLRGTNAKTGGEFEMLLLEENGVNDWWAMLRPGKRARLGTKILVLDGARKPAQVQATVIDINSEGHRRLQFVGADNVLQELKTLGDMPVPPYINRADAASGENDRRLLGRQRERFCRGAQRLRCIRDRCGNRYH